MVDVCIMALIVSDIDTGTRGYRLVIRLGCAACPGLGRIAKRPAPFSAGRSVTDTISVQTGWAATVSNPSVIETNARDAAATDPAAMLTVCLRAVHTGPGRNRSRP